ncbi:MAG: hypothetical protein FWG75_10635 [Cystobacterineae bacterium]|nr:hypothetical protein [Cystobacterineae bacterium]
MSLFFPLALLLLAQPHTSTVPPSASQTTATPTSSPRHVDKPTGPSKNQNADLLLGLRLDFGFPDGMGLDFLGYPLPFLQVHLGMATNLFGVGFRAGLSFILSQSMLRPVLTVEAGHHFNGASWVLSQNTAPLDRDFFSSIQYTFLNTLAGFDVGSANVAFTFRLGSSFLFFKSKGLPPQALDANQRVYAKKIRASMLAPSIKLGISICFF